jgi:SAM-dependent methyltransferase
MSIGQYKKLGKQGAEEFRRDVEIYGPKNAFNRAAYTACAFSSSSERIPLLDAMSGPGKFGKSIFGQFFDEKAQGGHEGIMLSVTFNDIREEPLIRLREEGYETVHCDVRNLQPNIRTSYHVVAVRFSLKDFPEGEKEVAIASLREALIPGGRLVIADMYAPSEASQEAVNRVHSAKQELAGRNPETEGVCFIPTEEQWITLVKKAGFKPVDVTYKGTSDVDTRQWSEQFGPEADDDAMIMQMNRVIAKAAVDSPDFNHEFNVHIGDNLEKVTVSFPILVIAGDKI